MQEIPLTRGKVAFVDDEDYERVIALGKWSAFTKDGGKLWYVHCRSRGKNVLLHRFILNFPSLPIDHADRDGLNNQKSNLRACSRAENNRNRIGTSACGFKGVHFCRPTKRWRAVIWKDYKRIHLGRFDTPSAAAKAYDAAAIEFHGEFARTNFGVGA